MHCQDLILARNVPDWVVYIEPALEEFDGMNPRLFGSTRKDFSAESIQAMVPMDLQSLSV